MFMEYEVHEHTCYTHAVGENWLGGFLRNQSSFMQDNVICTCSIPTSMLVYIYSTGTCICCIHRASSVWLGFHKRACQKRLTHELCVRNTSYMYIRNANINVHEHSFCICKCSLHITCSTCKCSNTLHVATCATLHNGSYKCIQTTTTGLRKTSSRFH